MATATTLPRTVAADHDHPVRGRLNSLALAILEPGNATKLGAVRRRTFGTLSGEVVDIGAGNGPSLKYLSDDVDVVHAIEPNRHFHARLHREARLRHVDLVVHATPGETLDLPEDSVDAVMTSWVLCTVADPGAILAEVRRVLRPGGRFAFVEHVAAPPDSGVRRVQDLVHRPWKWMFEGCHTTRDTGAAIRAAGFARVESEAVSMNTAFVPMRTQIAGTAWT